MGGMIRCALACAGLLMVAVAVAAEPAPPAAPVDFALLSHLADVYRSVRYDATSAEVERSWRGGYESLAVVDLPQTENRYAVGTLLGGRRQEVVIRGTANVRNAVFDAEVRKAWNARLGIRLHVGFERMARAVYDDLKPRLKPDADIVLFGHSLGAAEAVIVGLLLRSDGCRVAAVYASGQPKVTDREGAEKCSGLPVLRISCEGDPVPFLPPRTALSAEPYVHFGPEVMLLDGPYYAAVRDTAAEPEGLLDVWRMLKSETPSQALRLHLFATNYYQKYLAKAGGAIERTP